ncbi:hypothetical protein [Lentilactobacillus sp. Marseille-Q4993]|uniref:hypothetical protein n=1 Tax=Lentilactobacillus sp. Marseille-Q4993 TaxID=3039492 RepID=UPI0024BCF97C|nr:hypothetical protein [Lentilactobacillus sp. Marseille-Q4993]
MRKRCLFAVLAIPFMLMGNTVAFAKTKSIKLVTYKVKVGDKYIHVKTISNVKVKISRHGRIYAQGKSKKSGKFSFKLKHKLTAKLKYKIVATKKGYHKFSAVQNLVSKPKKNTSTLNSTNISKSSPSVNQGNNATESNNANNILNGGFVSGMQSSTSSIGGVSNPDGNSASKNSSTVTNSSSNNENDNNQNKNNDANNNQKKKIDELKAQLKELSNKEKDII